MHDKLAPNLIKIPTNQDRAKLEEVASLLEKLGVQVYLPHRDAGDLGSLQLSYGRKSVRDVLFARDVLEVKKCDILVAMLDGADVDSGTAVEMGIAYELGVPIFGLKSDFYRRNRILNNMIWGACSRGNRISVSEKGLLKQIKEFIKKETNGRRFQKR